MNKTVIAGIVCVMAATVGLAEHANAVTIVRNTTTTTQIADHSGSYCREFTQNITIGGQLQRSYGTACLQPDGSWQIQSSDGDGGDVVYDQPVQIQQRTVYITPPRPLFDVQFVYPFGYDRHYRHNYHPHRVHHWRW